MLSAGSVFAGYRIERVLGNVAIDISACRYDVTNQAVDILNAIAAKIPH